MKKRKKAYAVNLEKWAWVGYDGFSQPAHGLLPPLKPSSLWRLTEPEDILQASHD